MPNVTIPHINYRHDEHGEHESEWLHQYADALLCHVLAALKVRGMAGDRSDCDTNRAHCRTLIKRALALSDTVQGHVNNDDPGLLSFTLWHDCDPEPVTFWVAFDQVRTELRLSGLDI